MALVCAPLLGGMVPWIEWYSLEKCGILLAPGGGGSLRADPSYVSETSITMGGIYLPVFFFCRLVPLLFCGRESQTCASAGW